MSTVVRVLMKMIITVDILGPELCLHPCLLTSTDLCCSFFEFLALGTGGVGGVRRGRPRQGIDGPVGVSGTGSLRRELQAGTSCSGGGAASTGKRNKVPASAPCMTCSATTRPPCLD